jgi:crotonobetaine/carnitine-CoA ligase
MRRGHAPSPRNARRSGTGVSLGHMLDPPPLTALIGRDTASIGELLAARVARSPDSCFIRHAGRSWTYAEAWQASRRFAGFLAERGLAGHRIAAFLPKCPEALFSWFGANLAGGVWVALNRAHRGAVLLDLLARSRASLLVTDRQGWEIIGPLLPPTIAEVLFTDEVPPDARPALQAVHWSSVLETDPAEPIPCAPGAVATLLYTSGTTGRSKAVLLPHSMYVRGAGWLVESFGFRAGDIFHDWMPLSHIGGQLHVTMTAIVAGACLAQVPAFSRGSFREEVRASGATAFFGFSSILSLLLEARPGPDDRRHSLRVGLIGNMPAELLTAFQRRFGVRLLDTYGMSECEPLTLPVPGTPAGSCGRPSPDFEVAVLDEEDRPLPAGTAGRICIRPRRPFVMMLGYEDDPEATVEAWRNLWFHTADRGRLDSEGFLHFIDRMNYAIRRGGENISTSEVERVFLSHPELAACAAVGVPDPVMGEEVKLVAVPHPGSRIRPADLHAFAVPRMAEFMVPRYIELTTGLPYTDIGKLKREELTRSDGTVWDARHVASTE